MHPALKLRWSLTDDCHERPGRPRLLKAKADVHHKAMGNIRGPYGMASKTDWDEVNAARGSVFTSVPESAVMDVYNSVSSNTDSGVPVRPKSSGNGADAEKADWLD